MAKKQKQEEKVTFNYEGKDKRGQKIKGEMLALNSALARAELRRQGITPTKVVKKSQLSLLGGKKKITPADVAIFTRQMATMMKAGVPLVQSLDRKSTRLNSSHVSISYAVFCLKKKKYRA